MLRLGVIGYGRRIQSVLGTLERFKAGTRVVAMVDPRFAQLQDANPEKLAEVTGYASVERMLDEGELDGVMIGTRCNLHTPYAIKVLERGLPLFLEKPVCIDWEQWQALRDAYRKSTSPTVVSFPLRVSSMCETARQIVDSGVIGKIEHVQAVNNVPFYSGGYYHGWMRDDSQTGGLWMQKTTHDFDYINSLVRQRPVRISAMESKTVFRGDMPAGLRCVDCARQDECPESPKSLFRQGITDEVKPNEWQCSFAVDTGNHDSASALIQYASGIHAVYTQNFYSRRGAAARGVTLVGYHGTVKFDWYQDEIVVHHHHSNQVERHRFENIGGGHHGGDAELCADFIKVLTGSGTSRATLKEGLESAQLCLLAKDSCQTQAFQEVPAV